MNIDPRAVERIDKWLQGSSQGPFMLELRPTNNCNLKCRSCTNHHELPHPSEHELSFKQYMDIIDSAAELSVKKVQLVGGGEPMMRADVTLGIMQRARSRGMNGVLLTNGTLFDEHMIQQIVEMGWDTILFSVDGPTAEINDALRGVEGAFEKSTRAIRAFAQAKDELGLDYPTLVLVPVLSTLNCTVVKELVSLAAGLGMQKITFQPLHVGSSEQVKTLQLTERQKEELPASRDEALRLAESLGLETNLAEIDSWIIHSDSLLDVIEAYAEESSLNSLNVKCYSPWFYLGIDAHGRVGPCTTIDEETYRDNVKEHSLEECWNGPQFTELRKRLRSDDLPDTCRNCSGAVVMEMRLFRERLEGRDASSCGGDK